MDKAKKAQKKLDEVGTEISNIRADQTVDDGRILSLNGKADEQSNTNDKNWKDILDMIQEEGDLFSKISKKLKDEELRKVCACTHHARACACINLAVSAHGAACQPGRLYAQRRPCFWRARACVLAAACLRDHECGVC